MARKGRGVAGKGKPFVAGGNGKGKGKALVPPMKGAPAAPPPRPVRGRVGATAPVFPMGAPRRPPGAGPPPRMTPPMAAETPRAERLEPPPSSGAPVMQRRGAPQAMNALRRGKVAF